MADAVDPDDFCQVGGWFGAVGLAGAAGAGQVGGQVPGGLRGQRVRVGGGHDQADVPVGSPPAEGGVGGPPGLGVSVAEGAFDRGPVPGMLGVRPGQGAGGMDGGVGVLAVGPGAVARFEGHDERQPGRGEVPAEAVLVAVGAVGGHGSEGNSGRLGGAGEFGGDLQFRAEAGVLPALGEVVGGAVGHGVQRVVDVLVRPAGGHRHDAVVGFAQSAQPLPADVRGRLPVLAVARVVDHQHSAGVRRGRGIGQQQRHSAGVDLLVVPRRLGQEELQPLHRGMLGTDYGLGAGQGGQRLVAVPRQQQAREVLAEPAALCQGGEQVIEACGVGFQRARSGRTRHTTGHHSSQAARRRSSATGLLRP